MFKNGLKWAGKGSPSSEDIDGFKIACWCATFLIPNRWFTPSSRLRNKLSRCGNMVWFTDVSFYSSALLIDIARNLESGPWLVSLSGCLHNNVYVGVLLTLCVLIHVERESQCPLWPQGGPLRSSLGKCLELDPPSICLFLMSLVWAYITSVQGWLPHHARHSFLLLQVCWRRHVSKVSTLRKISTSTKCNSACDLVERWQSPV